MRVVIRVDSSYQIGSGHVMRCLTLADYLRQTGAEVHFICRDLTGNLVSLLKDRAFDLSILPASGRQNIAQSPNDGSYAHWLGADWKTDAEQTRSAVVQSRQRPDWLVIDHYALDYRWEEALSAETEAVFVIDDLANRRHNCSVLLDHNLSLQGEARYRNLVPADCRLLCGPAYALLRPEFEVAASHLRQRDGTVRRILIFFGGVDAAGMTLKACEAVVTCGREDLQVDVVVGVANTQREDVHRKCDHHPILRYHDQVCNMAELMAAADLAIGAGGTTTWERAFLGLAALTIPVAENQMPSTEAMADAGAIWNLGFHTEVSVDLIVSVLRRVFRDPAEVRRVGSNARALFGSFRYSGTRKAAEIMQEVANAKA